MASFYGAGEGEGGPRLDREAVLTQTTATVSKGRRRATSRRGLLLQDGLTFMALFLVTGALFGVTLFLFRSFEAHRDELAKRWSSRGMAAMAAGRPAAAIGPLRAALSYAPDETNYQLMLAEALAGAGKTDEAMNYFLNLWEARPGDAYINLQLARLSRRKNDAPQAINFYRAAVYGGWKENGIEARRAVRLELADYLEHQRDPAGARAELLIAAANAPDTVDLDVLLADRLWHVGDTQDALGLYRKALAVAPRNRLVLEHTGIAAYGMEDYTEAARLLRRAREAKPTAGTSGMSNEQLEGTAKEAERMVELSLSRELPAHTRAEHLMAAARVAQARLTECAARESPAVLTEVVKGQASKPLTTLAPPAPGALTGDALVQTTPLLSLRTQWKAADTRTAQRALQQEATVQDQTAELIYTTETQTAAVCGLPTTGDDAALLKMARAAEGAGKP